MSNTTPLLSTNDVAKILRCTPRTIRRRIKSGKLRALRDGGEWKIRPQDFDEYLNSLIPSSPGP